MTAPHDSVDPLLERLHRHSEAVAAFVLRGEAIPSALAERPRAPGKWTPIEEAIHLALTYREFAAVFGGAREFALLVPPEKAGQYRDTVLPRILAGGWFPSGAAAPERVHPPHESATMTAALAQLRVEAEGFHAAVRTAARAEAGRRWNHPYFGPIALAELLDLLTEHAHHHARFLP